MTALRDAIALHVEQNRSNPALENEDLVISWQQLGNAVDRLVSRIRNDGTLDRPIGLTLDHSIASAALLIGLIEADSPFIPLPPFFTEQQRAAALDQAGAIGTIERCSWADGDVDYVLEPRDSSPAPLPRGTAVISYSSGSTGAPKGVCLSADHLCAVATAVCDRLGRDTAGRHLPLLPFGILLEQVAGLYASLIAGGTYVPLAAKTVGLGNPLLPDPTAMLSAIDGKRITSLILVPEYLSVLVGAMEASGARLPLLNLVAVGGANNPIALIERARAVGLPLRQGYGLTETGSVIALEDGVSSPPGSVGRSIGAHRITLSEDGEIIIDGPLFLGLVGAPRSSGPLATGDIGRIDDDGNLWIEGRKSALIVTSHGRNISPEWIESLLLGQPEIAQAMVRGDGKPALDALIVPSSPDARIADALARVNAKLPGYARIAAFQLVPPFTPANGLLTGNGRLRRLAIDKAYPAVEDTAPFFDRLVAATREDQARFAMTPQLIAGLTGRISRQDYIAYLTQAYHHVRHTVPLMQAARQGLVARGDVMLVKALDDYIEEETGHEEWILDDIESAGGNRQAAAQSLPHPATRAMVDHAYRTIRDGNPAAFFGMVFVLEGTSIAMASSGADAVQRQLGLPKSAFRYLTSHGALDQDHMKFFEGLMNRIDDTADQQAIVAMARDMFTLFGGMFSAIELEGTLHAA